MNEAPRAKGIYDDILWPIGKVAQHWGVSESRARALLSQRGIERISGYPADQVRGVVRQQGARTDLKPTSTQGPASPSEGDPFGPVQAMVLRCLSDGEVWTPTRIAVMEDTARDSEAGIAATRVLAVSGLTHLQRRGYVENLVADGRRIADSDGWRITAEGRDAWRSSSWAT